MKGLQVPLKRVRKIPLTRNCRRKFIKNVLPEKRKENIQPNNCDLNRD